MRLDIRSLAVCIGVLASCGEPIGQLESASQNPGAAKVDRFYQPAPVLGTLCDCMPIHGTCDNSNGNCILTCDKDFADCNAKVADGCETSTTTIFDCGGCGRDCSCFKNAVCNAGKCGGNAEPNGTACNAPQPCGTVGLCQEAACICADKIDMGGMVGPSPDMSMNGGGPDMSMGGATPSGCTVAAGRTPSGAWVLGLLVAGVVLARRRRS